MDQELYDLAAWSMEAARSAGAGECRVRIRRERFVELGYRERKPESIREASTKALSIEVYVNGRCSMQSTSDLRREPLRMFISDAVGAAEMLSEDPYRTLPDPKYYRGRAERDLGIVDPEYGQLTLEDRRRAVQIIEDACLNAGGEKVVSVTATAHDGHVESVTLTSNGFEGYRASTTSWAVVSMTAEDEGNRRPMGHNYVAAVARKRLPAPEEIGTVAAKRTQDLLGAKKIKTETLPIIVENRNVPGLLDGFLAAMYGRSIQQRQSFLADRRDRKVGSASFTVIDDPLLIGGLGSRLYDDDGFAAKKRTMVESGVLRAFYLGWYYSRKLGWEPTTGGPSNLSVPPGERSVAEIMRDLGRGIYITGFIGGNSNSTTGDFSIGIVGQLFDNGAPVQAVAEMNIADNHLVFWNKLAKTAGDPWVYSSKRTPSLVFTDVVVSGV